MQVFFINFISHLKIKIYILITVFLFCLFLHLSNLTLNNSMLLYQYNLIYLFYMNADLLNNKIYIYVTTNSIFLTSLNSYINIG